MCGSAALAMAWVAAGRADSYKESRLYLWDIAAGLSLMESAKGAYDVKPLKAEGKPFCVEIRAARSKDFFVD